MSQAVSAAIVLALLLGVILVLQRPLVGGRGEAAVEADELRRADLESAKVAKYREIRDAELDRRTGKLSDADWRDADRRLREEAVEILRRLDELEPTAGPGQPASAPERTGADAPSTRADAPGTRADAPGTRADGPGTRADGPGTREDAPREGGRPGRRRTA